MTHEQHNANNPQKGQEHGTDALASSWSELLSKFTELGASAATLTGETARSIVSDLVQRGKVTAEEAKPLIDQLVARAHEQQKALSEMVDKSAERAMERMDVARKSDTEELRKRIETLEAQIRSLSRP